MRRLRRAHQRRIRKRKKFRQRAIAAGTAAAITLGTGVSLNKALAAHTPDPHELPVSQDVDADLLADKEELAIGYRVFKPDQNRNEIPDGVELAKRCAAVVAELPFWDPFSGDPEPNQTYLTIVTAAWGIETCAICGDYAVMLIWGVVNPNTGLRVEFTDMALHYMWHGSFGFNGIGYSGEGRVDSPRLMRVLEVRFPYEPNEHQLSVDSNDLDNDLLTDDEELETGLNLYNPDQDQDLSPDGIELAKQCAEVISELPVWDLQGDPPAEETYKANHFQRGLELCDICGQAVNMGYWQVINPKLGLSIDVYDITCHYMSHGSFSYSGDVHGAGRIDVAALVKVLEIPQRCGDLGTIYLPSDLDEDCKVDFADFADFADRWLQSTDPNDGSDIEY